jgi:hypothetical protein
MLLIFACASIPMQGVKRYTGVLHNATDLIVDVAIVEYENVPNGKEIGLVEKFMLSPGESKTVRLPAGHYHVYAACSEGRFFRCLVFPDVLRYPDKPWSLDFEIRGGKRDSNSRSNTTRDI